MKLGTLVLVLVVGCNNMMSPTNGVDSGDDHQTDAKKSGADADNGSGSASNDALVVCVSETNMYRAMNGKPALTLSTQLETYAATGAMFDEQAGSAHDHFGMTEGGGIAFAENECPGFDGWNLDQGGGTLVGTMKACILAFYSEGPGSDYSTHGHYINMMGDYGTLGCGVYQDANTVTITQDYGM